jgi:multicomponent Na+:H+ antiporter subunit F
MKTILAVLFLFAAASLYRLIKGPTIHDRLLSINMISSLFILILCTIGIIYGKSYYLDAAILYALLSFTEVIAFIRLYSPVKASGRIE